MTRVAWTSILGAVRERLADGARKAVWVDRGDEVLVHADTLTLERVKDALVLRLDLEADEVGREQIVVALALGLDASGKLVGAAETLPQSDGMLAARWGETVASALMGAIADMLATSRPPRRQELVEAFGAVLRDDSRGGRR